uniref:Uncharacterized protein n=1 Tax=Candidatus Kentrum sp. UNK TaxID=2126344 RepID=A0A451AIQ8_9GAMM|nr:MAG: hypothetical protein BECKUNK1418G_GA0071005_107317 [Candidatus Kentron sp. UNK]VFK71617.1 MAG: hypothetical protein BECKUNK1418H_GA0071006_107417 [Candidatus Kentron sp. UNK]
MTEIPILSPRRKSGYSLSFSSSLPYGNHSSNYGKPSIECPKDFFIRDAKAPAEYIEHNTNDYWLGGSLALPMDIGSLGFDPKRSGYLYPARDRCFLFLEIQGQDAILYVGGNAFLIDGVR